MAEQTEIRIPGTKAKIPLRILLLGGLAIVAIILLTRRGRTEEATTEDGLLAEELNQRLQEQWDALQEALSVAQQAPDTGLPQITPQEQITYITKVSPGKWAGKAAPEVVSPLFTEDYATFALPEPSEPTILNVPAIGEAYLKLKAAEPVRVAPPAGLSAKAEQTRLSFIAPEPPKELKKAEKTITKQKDKQKAKVTAPSAPKKLAPPVKTMKTYKPTRAGAGR